MAHEEIASFYGCDVTLDTEGFELTPYAGDPSRYFVHLPFPATVITVTTEELARYCFGEGGAR